MAALGPMCITLPSDDRHHVTSAMRDIAGPLRLASFRRLALVWLVTTAVPPAPALGQDEVERSYGSPAAVAIRQDSLMRIALNAADLNIRMTAILGIASPGRAWYTLQRLDNPPPQTRYPGTVARLRHIYTQTGASERELIVGLLAHQAERVEAVTLLGGVAQEHDGGPLYQLPLPGAAVAALSRMGADGAAELQRLHAAGLVVESNAKAQLERLARTGYRRPPGG